MRTRINIRIIVLFLVAIVMPQGVHAHKERVALVGADAALSTAGTMLCQKGKSHAGIGCKVAGSICDAAHNATSPFLSGESRSMMLAADATRTLSYFYQNEKSESSILEAILRGGSAIAAWYVSTIESKYEAEKKDGLKNKWGVAMCAKIGLRAIADILSGKGNLSSIASSGAALVSAYGVMKDVNHNKVIHAPAVRPRIVQCQFMCKEDKVVGRDDLVTIPCNCRSATVVGREGCRECACAMIEFALTDINHEVPGFNYNPPFEADDDTLAQVSRRFSNATPQTEPGWNWVTINGDLYFEPVVPTGSGRGNWWRWSCGRHGFNRGACDGHCYVEEGSEWLRMVIPKCSVCSGPIPLDFCERLLRENGSQVRVDIRRI